jgi:hypothetical protein
MIGLKLKYALKNIRSEALDLKKKMARTWP